MKITFIDPPNFFHKRNIERVFGCTYSLYPIPNIYSLYNAAVLEKDGFLVNYIDMANENWSKRRILNFIEKDDSDIYCFYTVNLSMDSDIRIAEEIRRRKGDAYIIFCGPAPTYFDKRFLKDESIFVIRGETEETILELIRCLKKGQSYLNIKGVSFLMDGKFFVNPMRPLIDNLDVLPFPARHLLKKEIYYNPKLPLRPFTVIQTSRNCPYRCVFCAPAALSFAVELEYKRYNEGKKPPLRLRSAESVVEEFEKLHFQGYKSVSIIDDQFLWDKKRTMKICEGIKSLGIQWGCLARADHLNEEIVKMLSESNCRYVDIGVESFRQNILDDIKKDIKLEMIYEAVRLLKKYNILCKVNLVLGSSPLQTRRDIKEDIRIVRHLGVDAVMFSIATPFPGTEFYKLAKQNGWFIRKDYYPESIQTKAIISYPHLSYRELNYLIKFANLSFYLSKEFIKKNIKYILNIRYFLNALMAFKRKFF
ncbi:MAG: B12-binding domain-containing radical SAM protein [Candidatus Omnitrophica bacterium]|nr:B12-binding domain-containing radical SAM protein [Candidatus Omnitrophota bacterium]